MMTDGFEIDPLSPGVRIIAPLFPAVLVFLWLIKDIMIEYPLAIGYGIFAYLLGYLFWGELADRDKKNKEEYILMLRRIRDQQMAEIQQMKETYEEERA